MTPERWQRVRDVLGQALELAPEKRGRFLDVACSSDPSLRSEVQSLLSASDQAASSFLQSPPILPSTLTPGTKLGDSEIISQIGSGGMGVVYRARDLRLSRDVAIKVLPPHLSADANRLRRFEQEAKSAAALNHPNILAVYQLGTYEGAPYLVSELLEGGTLRDELRQGALPRQQAMDYAEQIADGLNTAHKRGIIHRDLKPENLFVTNDNRVKILDFGLAKLALGDSDSAETVATLGLQTHPGLIAGTVGYMSPEQVRGEKLDTRTDLFSFGVVLYEMATGKRPFDGDTSGVTFEAILNRQPTPPSKLNAKVPRELERIISKALEKDREVRYQHASEVRTDLQRLRRDTDSARMPAASAEAPSRTGMLWKVTIPVALTTALLALASYLYLHRSPKLAEKDTIVLADFANRTGDAVFDDTLKQALTVSLRQSPFLNIVSDDRVSANLKLMMRPADTRLTPEVAREVCLRADSKAYIAGSIAPLGTRYVLGLSAVNCHSREILAQEQVTATSKEGVLDALGVAATKLRAELGESRSNVQKFDIPLEQATTSSLEALRAYSNGDYERAIRLDPEFALAYLMAGNVEMNEKHRREYLTRAFELSEHASEREKLMIAGMYYQGVTGELDKAAKALEELVQTYPHLQEFDSVALPRSVPMSANPYVMLGHVYVSQGRYEESIKATRQGLKFVPSHPPPYFVLANALFALNRFDEVKQVLQEALTHIPGEYPAFHFRIYLYALSFVTADSRGVAEYSAWLENHPVMEWMSLAIFADTAAYEGRLRKAREMARRAVGLAPKGNMAGTTAEALIHAALREANIGDMSEALRAATEALKLEPTAQDVQIEAALVFAISGDSARSGPLAQDLAKHYPLDTIVQTVWLPAIYAQLALKKNPILAIERLQVTKPLDLSWDARCLYPIYLRGEAYLAARQGSAAAAEFQKIIDHAGIVSTCWTGALAHLQLGRAYIADGDIAKARSAYHDFLMVWKDADPDVLILKQAKAEYARLQ